MRILVARNHQSIKGEPVHTYSTSIVRVLREKGHEVVDVPKSTTQNYDGIDLCLDIDCGRNDQGDLVWQAQDGPLPCKSAVMFIDSHGYPSLHRRLAKSYDHVFFAVYDKRDLFVKHPSAYWCPNFSDLKWFDGDDYEMIPQPTDFGFFGTKGGLSRADAMEVIAMRRGWTADIRQISVNGKHRWPQTAVAMSNCRTLFNKGQKHDSPNLRVMESMLMNRVLISDQDERSGMDLLFKAGGHYVPYEYFSFEGLEEAMEWCVENPQAAAAMAREAYEEVKANHLVGNRVDQILEVVGNG